MKKKETNHVMSITVFLLVTLFFVTALSGCTTQQKNTIKIEGAFALTPMMEKWSAEYKKIHPEINIDINANGAGAGMANALNKLCDIGMVSREIHQSEIEQGAFWVSVVKDAVVATINANNPVIDTILSTGLTKQQFKDIYITGTLKTWGQLIGKEEITQNIIVYTRSDSCGAAETWAQYLGDYKQNDLGALVDLDRISAVNGDNTLAATIQREQYGIGFNNIAFVYTKVLEDGSMVPADGILPVPIDLNENGTLDEYEQVYANRTSIVDAINNDIYPSPPARPLHLVTSRNFTGIVKDFVHWILVEGQQYVLDAGYVPLSDSIITTQLQYLESGTRPELQ
jgi:phosphate transport system substrate-binding protein